MNGALRGVPVRGGRTQRSAAEGQAPLMEENLAAPSGLCSAIVFEEPEAKSELVESILMNGDLDSFYERIA